MLDKYVILLFRVDDKFVSFRALNDEFVILLCIVLDTFVILLFDGT